MKAILVIEMPKSCFACPLWDESDYADGCMVFRRQTHDIDHGEQREEWCPLKPVPKWEINRECAFQNGAPVPDDMVFDFLEEICDESNTCD